MKSCCSALVSAFLVLLVRAPLAGAMTLEEFLAPKSENLKIAVYVLGQSELGGVQGQLERAQNAIAQADKETTPGKKEIAAKLAWFYAVHSAFLADTAVSPAEAGSYKKMATEALVGATAALDIPKPDLESLIKETAQLFGEAEKNMTGEAAPDSPSKGVPQINSTSKKLPNDEYTTDYFYKNENCTGNMRFIKNEELGKVEIQTVCGEATCYAEYIITNIFYDGPHRIIELGDANGGTNRLVSKYGYILENNDTFYCGNGGMMKGEYLDRSIYGSKPKPKKDIPSSEEQKIANLLQIAKTAPAQSEKARGKSFPILTASTRESKQFDSSLFKAIQQNMSSINSKDPFTAQSGMENAWNNIGYSLDATLRDTFSNITPDQYFRCQGNGTFNIFLSIMQFFKDESMLKSALEKGAISRDSAVAFLSATQRVSDAMKQMQQ